MTDASTIDLSSEFSAPPQTPTASPVSQTSDDSINLKQEFSPPPQVDLKKEFSAPDPNRKTSAPTDDNPDNLPESIRLFDTPEKRQAWNEASPMGRLGLMVDHPWDLYQTMVHRGWQGASIPKIEAPVGSSITDRAQQLGAALDNTAIGAGSSLVTSPATISLLNPLTAASSAMFSAPSFIADGLKSLMDSLSDPTFQGRLEKVIGGELMVGGGAHIGLKGAESLVPESPAKEGPTTPTPQQAIDAMVVKLRTAAENAQTPDAQMALDHAADGLEHLDKNAPKNPMPSGIPTAESDSPIKLADTPMMEATPEELSDAAKEHPGETVSSVPLKPLPENAIVSNPKPGEIGTPTITVPGKEGGEPRFPGSSEPAHEFHGTPEEAAAAGYDVDLSKEFRLGESPVETPPNLMSEDQATDYHRYNAIQAQIKSGASEQVARAKQGLGYTPEFQALMEENESIKNRNTNAPGMPPSEPGTDLSEQGLAKEAARSPSVSETTEPPAFPPIKEADAATPDESSNYGIAARVSDARSASGHIEPVESGEGASPEEMIQHGRDLIDAGRDPEVAMSDFEKTGKTSSDDISLARAHGEDLAQAASAAAEKSGIGSDEYKYAAKSDSDWVQRVKAMQTEWHKQGQAMQGETEIDTGSFHGLARAYKEASGKDFTPQQAAKAQEISDEVAKSRADVSSAQQTVFDFMKDMPRSIKDDSVQQVWSLAKQYLQDGEDNLTDIAHKIATDTGMSVDEVRTKLAQPKGSKPITDDMYAKMSRNRDLEASAKAWIQNQRTPGWQRVMQAVPRAFFKAKTMLHGTVWLVTHASPEIFKPNDWAQLFPNYFKAFKLMGIHDGGAYHERMMQDLERDPNFITARRAGLENDPSKQVDDYQKTWIGGWFNKLGLIGNRGFDGLKLLRQDLFNKAWNEMPDSMKTKDQAKMLADSINHSTGATNALNRLPQSVKEWSGFTFFAPRLVTSQWQWMLTDPAKAAKTLSSWDSATDAEKQFAIRQIKEKATVAGTYLTLLAANQAILNRSGSNQRVNFTDPTRSDYLKFKAHGDALGIGTPYLGNARLLVSMVNSIRGAPADYQKREDIQSQLADEGEQYVRGKLAPFASVAADFLTHGDYEDRPMPFSNAKVKPSLNRQGIYTRYSWPEYLSEQGTMIPVSDTIKEIWRHQGMDETTMDHWMGALMSGAVSGTTGARIGPDTNPSGK